MKKINIVEQKKIMVEILAYFDKVCRQNNINYSLIGGSLIGAIRHQGIIPWDDDIDVILSRDNYLKIIEILEKDDDARFKILTKNNTKDYFFPFPKLVDKRTYVVEHQNLEQISEYGIYIDIFSYNFMPNSQKERTKAVKKIKLYNSMMSRKKLNFKKEGIKQNFLRFNKNMISKVIGYDSIYKKLEKIYNKYSKNKSDYVVSNWPIYDISKEIQKSNSIAEYINVSFENIQVMIFKNYDEILKTTFGDYMQLPPEDKRKSHGLEAYWRNYNEEKEC